MNNIVAKLIVRLQRMGRWFFIKTYQTKNLYKTQSNTPPPHPHAFTHSVILTYSWASRCIYQSSLSSNQTTQMNVSKWFC